MIKRTFVAVLLLLASLALTAQELSGNYEQLFKEGITAFDNQDFETARSKFMRVVNMPETSPALRNEANEFIKSCDAQIRRRTPGKATSASGTAAKKKEPVIEAYPANLSLPSAGGTKEITIECNARWEITSKP